MNVSLCEQFKFVTLFDCNGLSAKIKSGKNCRSIEKSLHYHKLH